MLLIGLEKKFTLCRWLWVVVEMGRISVDIPDELEKKLRFKTIERFGGRKGDLSRAVEEAVKTWVAKEEKSASTHSLMWMRE